MESTEVQYLIVIFSLALFLITATVFILMVYMQKKRVQHLLEKEKTQAEFEENLFQAQIEISEQNLKNISWELHDNIGQLLSVALLESKMLLRKETELEELSEVSNLISQSITQIRGLSKSLNFEMIQKLGLSESIENELARIERLKILHTHYSLIGEIQISKKHQIIIFRMLQEFISNVLKHAEAKNLWISITEKDEQIEILGRDDGVGYDKNLVSSNNGFTNLHSRATMVNAQIKLDSSLGEGSTLFISIPKSM